MDREPYNEFLLVMPKGNCKGFNDFESAKAYINIYYEKAIDENIDDDDENDMTEIGSGDTRINICTKLGVEEGKCELYKTEDLINKVTEELVFDIEKKEIIERLCDADINFNVYDNNLDLLLSDIEPINIMEAYGDIE